MQMMRAGAPPGMTMGSSLRCMLSVDHLAGTDEWSARMRARAARASALADCGRERDERERRVGPPATRDGRGNLDRCAWDGIVPIE